MRETTKVFIDMEFTGFHQATTPLSIGLVDEFGRSFYGEFEDYDKSQIDPWLEENIMPYLLISNPSLAIQADQVVIGTREQVREGIAEWLSSYEYIELWGDLMCYDMVLFDQLFGGAFGKPDNVYYISFDICTYFKVLGIDPDVSREDFGNVSLNGFKHNALYDARVVKACYERLMTIAQERIKSE